MTTRRAPLKAVKATDRPVPAKPKTITQAANEGTERELLVAMRQRIAKAVESELTSPRDLAALSKRLMEIVREIETLDARSEQEGGESDRPADVPFDASAI